VEDLKRNVQEVNEMPWGDGTGPWWMGARGYRASGYMPVNPWCRGRSMGLGRGFGWRYAAYDPFRQPTSAEEMGDLEDVARRLEEDLKAIRERIEQLRSTV
jgi:hypothetical protein